MYFFVECIPQGKERPRFDSRTRRAYTPAKTRAYEDRIARAFRHAAIAEDFEIISGPVELTIVAGFPVPKSYSQKSRASCLQGTQSPTKRPDADNIEKAVADALNGIAYFDDAQIVRSAVTKTYAEIPGLRIWVSPLTPQCSD